MSLEEEVDLLRTSINNLHEKIEGMEKLTIRLTDIKMIVALDDIELTIKFIAARAGTDLFSLERGSEGSVIIIPKQRRATWEERNKGSTATWINIPLAAEVIKWTERLKEAGMNIIHSA